ncbi:MAG: M23 family metallopeptidase [Ornithinimicrobium sp.]
MVLQLAQRRGYVALAHLQYRSISSAIGDVVRPGQQLGACGNSGKSTEPHVHVQVMDGPDPMAAQGVPIAFLRCREHHRGTDHVVESGLPAEGSIIEPAE